jgi:uncharacterized repeat protein (TIGR03803 family)
MHQNRLLASSVALAIALALPISVSQPAQAQTFAVIHTFSGTDGANPEAGLTLDRAGSLYGTTYGGGRYNSGAVFKLRRGGSGWVLNPLYAFTVHSDGEFPDSAVTLGTNGSIYGTASQGGTNGDGTVFHLTPDVSAPKSVISPWTETTLLSFGSGSGTYPRSRLVFDQAGNLYGTTQGVSSCGQGTVYQLTPSGNGWTETILHCFTGAEDGTYPAAGVVLDNAGNIYGTTGGGGSEGQGVVYELIPSQSGWQKESYTASEAGRMVDNPLAT